MKTSYKLIVKQNLMGDKRKYLQSLSKPLQFISTL